MDRAGSLVVKVLPQHVTDLCLSPNLIKFFSAYLVSICTGIKENIYIFVTVNACENCSFTYTELVFVKNDIVSSCVTKA